MASMRHVHFYPKHAMIGVHLSRTSLPTTSCLAAACLVVSRLSLNVAQHVCYVCENGPN